MDKRFDVNYLKIGFLESVLGEKRLAEGFLLGVLSEMMFGGEYLTRGPNEKRLDDEFSARRD